MSTALSEELKHTPGPWHVDVDSVRNSNGEQVADCGTLMDLQTEMANARLIAAAPECYAANRAVMDAIDGHTEWSPNPEVDTDDWNEDWHINITLSIRDCRLLKAAIAKAEGRAE